MRSLIRTVLFCVAAGMTATATACPIESVAAKPSDALAESDETAGISFLLLRPICPLRTLDLHIPSLPEGTEGHGLEALANQAVDCIELNEPPKGEFVCWWGGWLFWTGGW